MKFDRFLAALFSRKAIVIILLVVMTATFLTACELTFEDVLCLTFCGCVSLDTCREMIMSATCGDCSFGFEGCMIECDSCGGQVGDAYNGCFGCIWEAGLKNCNPSALCSKCEADENEDYVSSAPATCDECMIDCLDGCVRNLEGMD